MKELRWLDPEPGKPHARFEKHTAENATPACKPDCVGHYVFPIMLALPTVHRVIHDLKAE